MARHDVMVPQLGESVDNVIVIEWHCDVGATIATDDVLVTVETDKVDIDIPSPVGGTLVEIIAPAGAHIAIGDRLCVIDR